MDSAPPRKVNYINIFCHKQQPFLYVVDKESIGFNDAILNSWEYRQQD